MSQPFSSGSPPSFAHHKLDAYRVARVRGLVLGGRGQSPASCP